ARRGGNVLAVELLEDVFQNLFIELDQGLGIEVALEDADELFALGLAQLLEDRGLAGGAQFRQQRSRFVGPLFGERGLDSPDQLRRHLVEDLGLAVHPRASARRCASTAASAVMLRMPRAVTEGVKTCAGSAVPSIMGPICRPSAACFSRLKAILAASSEGQTTRLAGTFRRERGKAVWRMSGSSAASPCISPSTSSAGARRCRGLPASGLLRAEGCSERPKLECEISATLGWMPKRSTSSAASSVMSTRVSTSGSWFT